MHGAEHLEQLNADQLREFAARLISELSHATREVSLKSLQGEQRHLFEETAEADLEAIGLELEALKRTDEKTLPKEQPRRAPLPGHLPRTEVRHEPDSTICACGCAMKRIGEDVSEKLEYTPGVFSVERHIRGKWPCAKCQTLMQAPVPAQVIDKGIPTAGLLAHVLVAKSADAGLAAAHKPAARVRALSCRRGISRSRSAWAAWARSRSMALSADVSGRPMLQRQLCQPSPSRWFCSPPAGRPSRCST